MIKAIETHYDGHHFRSRLEARWAVFFNAMGIDYRYEYQGYDTKHGYYLPDFWIPSLGLLIEVKPESIEDDERKKYEEMLAEIGEGADDVKCAVILWKPPMAKLIDTDDTDAHYQAYPYWDNYFQWCMCNICGAVGIVFSGRCDYLCGHGPGKNYGYEHPAIIAAMTIAQQARFDRSKTTEGQCARLSLAVEKLRGLTVHEEFSLAKGG